MNENILNISDNSHGKYATRLNIVNTEGLDKFLKALQEIYIYINLLKRNIIKDKSYSV